LRCGTRPLSCTCSPIHATNSPSIGIGGFRRDGRKAKRPRRPFSLGHPIILAGFRSYVQTYVQPRSSSRLRLAASFPTGRISGICTLDDVGVHWQAGGWPILLNLEGNQAEARLIRVRGLAVVRRRGTGTASSSEAKALSCSPGKVRTKDFTNTSASRRQVVKS
jgi:hypothetical protein